MPTYRIRCGDMDAKIKTPFEADAATLAALAVDKKLPQKPGMLVEVKGGQYSGDACIYVPFEAVAMRLASRDERSLSDYVWRVLEKHCFGHGISLSDDGCCGNESDARHCTSLGRGMP